MVTVHSCHGAYVFQRGKGSTDLLRPYFQQEGFAFREHDYIPMGLFMAAIFNERIARKLAKKVKFGDIGVGHSSGCDILLRAARNGAPFSQLVLINPALDSNVKFPRQLRHIHVWHSPSDLPVKIAEHIPFHHWGNMGAIGYTGLDMRVTNYNKEQDYPECVSDSHSDFFEPEILSYLAPIMVEKVKMKMGA